jgi:hypothetical protein
VNSNHADRGQSLSICLAAFTTTPVCYALVHFIPRPTSVNRYPKQQYAVIKWAISMVKTSGKVAQSSDLS